MRRSIRRYLSMLLVMLMTVSAAAVICTKNAYAGSFSGGYISLGADLTEEEKDYVYLCINKTNAIIERPKMIYNEETKKYIIWFHADGPTEESDSSYAAAAAGMAISDTPNGPPFPPAPADR